MMNVDSSLMTNAHLDLSPQGLFPQNSEAAKDDKCLIIAKVLQEIAQSCNMSNVKQEAIQKNAQLRYRSLSDLKKLTLSQADDIVYKLYGQGVKPETAKTYCLFYLTQEDAKQWTIITTLN
jgi:hypothetical protein